MRIEESVLVCTVFVLAYLVALSSMARALVPGPAPAPGQGASL